LRTLAKRYRNIRNDIQPVIAQLQAGELPGDRPSPIYKTKSGMPFIFQN